MKDFQTAFFNLWPRTEQLKTLDVFTYGILTDQVPKINEQKTKNLT